MSLPVARADRRQPADRARPGAAFSARALAERLATAARFCAGESGAERQLEAQAFEGTARAAQAAPSRRPAAPRPTPPGLGRLADRRHCPARPAAARLVARRGRRARSAGPGGGRLPRGGTRAAETAKPRAAEPVAITATGAARPLAERDLAHAAGDPRDTGWNSAARRKHKAPRDRRDGCWRPMRSATRNTPASPSRSRWR